jgi:hypothetical protein
MPTGRDFNTVEVHVRAVIADKADRSALGHAACQRVLTRNSAANRACELECQRKAANQKSRTDDAVSRRND